MDIHVSNAWKQLLGLVLLSNTERVGEVLTELSPADRLKVLSEKAKYGSTAVHIAASKGHTETVKCMINSLPPADLYRLLMIQDEYGDTAVHRAGLKGHTETVNSVLAKLTPTQCLEILNMKDNMNKTLLEKAGEWGRTETVSCIEEVLQREEDAVKAQQVDTSDERQGASSSVDASDERQGASSSVGTSDKRQGASNSVGTGDKRQGASSPVGTSDERKGASSFVDKSDERQGASGSADLLTEVLQDIKLGEKLGSGGQATVYKGTWFSTPVAVKMIPNSAYYDISSASLEQLEEYNAIKGLRHPNIVQFYGVAHLEEGIGLVMELGDTDLFSLTRPPSTGSDTRPSSQELLNVIKDALHGLVYLHSKDMIHMDIKPDNILVQHGRGKLADFGLSDLVDNFMPMTVTHSAWSGTPLYRAPELLHRGAPSKAADLWSMGITALEIVTDSVPYKGITRYKGSMVPKDLLENKFPPVLQQLNPRNQSIFRMVLNFDPSERLSAREWLVKLDDYKF